jgi:hypothetical protein
MNQKNALVTSVAILCLLTVWVTSMPSVAVLAPTYAVFLSWASFFTAGGDKKALNTSIITNVCGALWGYVGVKVFLPLFGFAGATWALPIAIFFVGGGMVAQSYWSVLAFVPGCFIGCSTFFAVANSALIGPTGLEAILLATSLGLVVGDIIGYVSVLFGNVMTKKNDILNKKQEA